MAIFNFNNSLMVGSNNSMGNYTVGCLIGNNLTLGSNNQIVVGKYNQVLGSDYIFIVGNGSSSARSNAMVISENGNVNISGMITPDGGYNNLPDRVTSLSVSGSTIKYYVNGSYKGAITLSGVD